MPKSNPKSPSSSDSYQSSVRDVQRAQKAQKSAALRVGIPEAISAVFTPTGAPNNALSEDSLGKANQERSRLIEAGKELKQDWLDEEHWRRLAAQKGYRLPHWYLPLTPKGIERVLRDLGLGKSWFIEHFGKMTYKRFVSMNPKMPLWVFAGQCLELSGSK